jgi:DNA/RNA endonuclease G (NUC1)
LKALRNNCRKLTKTEGRIDITCGSYGHAGEIGKHKVWLPAYCWKVIRYNDEQVEYYLMFNTTTVNLKNYTAYKVNTLNLPASALSQATSKTAMR